MAQIVKSSHPKTKFGQKYACGGQVKKFADGGQVEEPAPLSNEAINRAVVSGAQSMGEKLKKGAATLGYGAAKLFKSPEAVAAERAAADAEMIRKASQ